MYKTTSQPRPWRLTIVAWMVLRPRLAVHNGSAESFIIFPLIESWGCLVRQRSVDLSLPPLARPLPRTDRPRSAQSGTLTDSSTTAFCGWYLSDDPCRRPNPSAYICSGIGILEALPLRLHEITNSLYL